MKFFLDSLGWTVFWGVVLTLVLYNIVKCVAIGGGQP